MSILGPLLKWLLDAFITIKERENEMDESVVDDDAARRFFAGERV